MPENDSLDILAILDPEEFDCPPHYEHDWDLDPTPGGSSRCLRCGHEELWEDWRNG